MSAKATTKDESQVRQEKSVMRAAGDLGEFLSLLRDLIRFLTLVFAWRRIVGVALSFFLLLEEVQLDAFGERKFNLLRRKGIAHTALASLAISSAAPGVGLSGFFDNSKGVKAASSYHADFLLLKELN